MSTRLKLATSSLDGYVRLYEAIDVMNLAHWPLAYDFEAAKGLACNTLAWNPDPFDKELLAVGTNDHFVKIFEYNDASRKWLQVPLTFLFLPLPSFSPYPLSPPLPFSSLLSDCGAGRKPGLWKFRQRGA